MIEQIAVFITLAGALILFVIGKIRYDLVAMLALMVLTLGGIIPAEATFSGFANPAVVTVVAVLVLSRALENAGLVDIIGRWVVKAGTNATQQVALLAGLVTLLSAFINNVGALALLIPVAIQLARQSKRSPSFLLMPMAFGSLLGGMTTLIGTPPNLIIAEFRRNATGQAFSMFDFSPVGVGVALAGVLFIALLGWRMVPNRRGHESRENLFHIEDYLSEITITEESRLVGKRIDDLLDREDEVVIVSLIRNENRISTPSKYLPLRAGDILLIRADPTAIARFVEKYGVTLDDRHPTEGELESAESSLVEAVVTRFSVAERRTARDLSLRNRFRTNLLAIARRGQTFQGRLSDERFRVGDILLLLIPDNARADVLSSLGLLPLTVRNLRLGQSRRLFLCLSVFVVALVLAAIGLFPSAVAFSAAAVMLILAAVISLREAYESVDWSIVVLLGAMIPVGQALETTGGANTISNAILHATTGLAPFVILGLVLFSTTLLSSIINNASAAIVMAPVAINIAQGIGAAIDPFLLAVAIGASCAFLTPIGHQSNTLVMGPGGYYFGDYWPLGICVELIVVVTAIPLLYYFWPLFP